MRKIIRSIRELHNTGYIKYAKRCTLCFIILALLVGCSTAPIPKPTGDYYWPLPPDPPKIKWVTWWTGSKDFEGSSSVLTFLLGEERWAFLWNPNGVITDLAGNLYVADPYFGVIYVFNFEKKTVEGIGKDEINGPLSLAMDNKSGVIYATDTIGKMVVGFDTKTGKVMVRIGASGEFKNPSGIAFDDVKERLYVSDSLNHTIRVYDKYGKYLFNIGKRGGEDGQFNFPSYLTFHDGKLYVADTLNYRIQIFDGEGKFLKKFGKIGDSAGLFARPKGIGVDSEGHIYVVDSAFDAFQIFDENGQLLLVVGKVGRGPGGFDMPTGLYIDRQDRIYISDTFNHRVQVFQYLKGEQGLKEQSPTEQK